MMMRQITSSSSRCVSVRPHACAAVGRSGRGATVATQKRRRSSGLIASISSSSKPSSTLCAAASSPSSSDGSSLSLFQALHDAATVSAAVDSEEKTFSAIACAVAKFAATAALLSAIAWVLLPSGSALAAATKACCKKGGAAAASSFSIAETAKGEELGEN